jgi:hypothetical protein
MKVLKNIMSHGIDKIVLEASLGLCVQISKLTRMDEFMTIAVVGRIKSILRENIYPNATIPCLRRHVIELVIWIMKTNNSWIQYFKEAGMEKILVQTAESTAEFENFHYFSENFGVMEHPKTISSLVLEAKLLLA